MPTTNGWKSQKAAKHYMSVADALIPYRAEILETISSLAVDSYTDGSFILDLGCGNGELTQHILLEQSDIPIVMVDFSDTMLQEFRNRFAGLSNVSIIQYDLNRGLPPAIKANSCSVAVSSFALHHVEVSRRVALYTDIFTALLDNGIFINGDRFIEEGPHLSEWTHNRWIQWMADSIKRNFSKEKSFQEVKKNQQELDAKQGDMPGTMWQMREDLLKTGYATTDVIWKTHVVGIVSASKKL